MRKLLEFYAARRFRRLRFKTFIRKQKAVEKLVRDLRGGHKKEEVTIILGDASFPSSGRGCPPVPTKSLHRAIVARADVILYDEFRTSKLCPSCAAELGNKRNPRTGALIHRVRSCTNSDCKHRIWERNVSACLCILRLYLRESAPPSAEYPLNGRRDPRFCRPVTRQVYDYDNVMD
jgi:hypothetical protein